MACFWTNLVNCVQKCPEPPLAPGSQLSGLAGRAAFIPVLASTCASVGFTSATVVRERLYKYHEDNMCADKSFVGTCQSELNGTFFGYLSLVHDIATSYALDILPGEGVSYGIDYNTPRGSAWNSAVGFATYLPVILLTVETDIGTAEWWVVTDFCF